MAKTASREIVDRGDYIKWWAALAWSVLTFAFALFLLWQYGVNSPAGVLGVMFSVGAGWLFSQALSLRRYVWYGDLD